MATEFKINNSSTIICKVRSTRTGFSHSAVFYKDGVPIASRSVGYINRTWESYNFESVISLLLDKMKAHKMLTAVEVSEIKTICKKIAYGQVDEQFKSTAMVAALGDIFGKSEKESNDWKVRMIKAGLGEGVQMPEDWGTLSEAEKKKRLDKIIGFMKERK